MRTTKIKITFAKKQSD